MPDRGQQCRRHSIGGNTPERKLLGQKSNVSRASRRSLPSVITGLCLLVSTIILLAAPTNMFLSRGSGVRLGVSAASCNSNTSATAVAGETELVIVTPTSASNLTTMFNCEDGEFEVLWSGEVSVSGTIVIGNRTTVTILGNSSSAASSIDADNGTSAASASFSSTTGLGSSSSSSSSSSSNSEEQLEKLTASRLTLPSGLTSAVVGAGPRDKSVLNDTKIISGPIFSVYGGNLVLQDLIVRDGYAANATDSEYAKGGGILAVDADVNVTRCEFRDNFAVHWGGGIYAEESTLVVVDSLFAGCRAGFQSFAGEEDAEGTGGGIAAKDSNALIDGCLFEGNYANIKGGAVHHEDKQISIIGSVFYSNEAGSENEEDKDPKGYGADLSLAECQGSFDGEAACGVNDTIFVNGHVGNKGGSVYLSGGEDPWNVEFHRCSVEGSTAGVDFEDNPQGEGGAFSVGEGVTLLLADCTLTENSCGKKGGVLTLSPAESPNEPAATVIMRNSSFESNRADRDNGGVVSVGECWKVVVEGDGNVFRGNKCNGDGGVFRASTNSSIIIEGGLFIDNSAEENGAVIWSKGELTITDGNFTNNKVRGNGGVLYASEFSTFTLAGGIFQGNGAKRGGVVHTVVGTALYVEGGVYSGNVAESQGGVFLLADGTQLKITGGNFTNNKADFGGFLYKEGAGETSCTGASIVGHDAVDGGAIYAVDGATVHWACDIRDTSAISGPAIYARADTTVILQDMCLVDNTVAQGSVVFVISSHLQTYQVEFSDSSRSERLSAVHVNEGSSYMAEDTSFVGFAGEAVVFSEGVLFLDNCDFSRSTSPVLVYSEPNTTAVIRNAMLGDNNYLGLTEDSSKAGELPNANSFTNADHTCPPSESERTGGSSSGSHSSSGSQSHPSVCSEFSSCLDGDLGVYCQCYYPQRTINSSKEERCVSGDPFKLALTLEKQPGETLFPRLLEGDIILSYNADASTSSQAGESSSASDDISSSSNNNNNNSKSSNNNSKSSSTSTSSSTSSGSGDGEGGVVWTVEALLPTVGTTSLVWTIFPSTGLLLPGQSVTLRVVTRPSEFFDGTAFVTFGALNFLLDSTKKRNTSTSHNDDNNGNNEDDIDGIDPDSSAGASQAERDRGVLFLSTQGEPDVAPGGTTPTAQHDKGSTSLSPPGGLIVAGGATAQEGRGDILLTSETDPLAGVLTTVNFSVTFYHCAPGSFWNPTELSPRETTSDESRGVCKLCTEEMDGTPEGVNCSSAGATIETLPIKAGFWRATLSEVFIRECSNEDACKGGTMVTVTDDYCGEGYEGPQCEVCSSGYGRGAAKGCHTCSQSFKIGMYYVVVLCALVTLVVVALLAVYLVEGKEAVSSTVASTKEAVLTVKRRGAGIGLNSVGGGGGGGRGSIGVGPLQSRKGMSTLSSDYSPRRAKRVGGKTAGSTQPQQKQQQQQQQQLDMSINMFSVAATLGASGEELSTSRPIGGVGGGGGGGGGGGVIQRQSRLPRVMFRGGLSSFFGSSCRWKRSPGGSSVDANSAAALGTGAAKSAATPEVGSTRAYGREGAPSRGRKVVGGKSGKSSAATRIGETLARLPLPKVKIVIVVWQISSAFADVTNAGFPPIYEKFLSVIGIFSMDLGWILSAACLATDITFYDELLIVTIGPLILMGLLAITFIFGSRPRKPRATEQPMTKTRSWTSSAADTSTRSLPKGGRASSRFNTTTAAAEHINTTSSQHDHNDNSLPGAMVGEAPAVRGLLPPHATEVTVSGDAADSSSSGDVVTHSRDGSWLIDVGGAGGAAAEPGRNASAPQGPRRQPTVASEKSVRKMLQAGPGNDMNVEQNRLWGLFARHTTMTLIILYLIYSQVSTVVFQTFACADYHEISKSYLRADTRIECGTPTHTAYRIYAALMICVYPLGIPAAFAFLLIRQRSAINPPNNKTLEQSRETQHVVLEKIERRRMDLTVTPTSFLWSAYYPNRYYFEVFECMRRLLLTGVLVFVPDTSGQVAYGCLFAFISLWAFELQRPHIDGLEIQLYRTGCLVIFFTNFLALIIQAELAQADSSSSAVYSVVLILVNVLFILSIGWNSVVTMKATFSRIHVQGMYLGVDFVSEDVADNTLGPEKEEGDKASAAGGVDADFKTEDNEMVPAGQTEAIAKPPSFDTHTNRR